MTPSAASPRVYCSQVGTNSSMLGTADPVDVWLFLEYKPSWSARAITEGGLSTQVGEWLTAMQTEAAERGLKLRPPLVRQPEIDSEQTRLMVAANDQLARFAGTGYQFVTELTLNDLLGQGEVTTNPRYFVCTNGKRDLCCARFGLPIYQRLRELVGDRVWQVTHLGGHRFAPNVLVAPQNLLYGRLQLDNLEAWVERVEQGQVDFTHLRGRTEYPKAVQAAETLVGEQGLRLLHVRGDENEPGEVMQIEFANAAQRYSIGVRCARQPEMIQGSCGDADSKPYYPFETVA